MGLKNNPPVLAFCTKSLGAPASPFELSRRTGIKEVANKAQNNKEYTQRVLRVIFSALYAKHPYCLVLYNANAGHAPPGNGLHVGVDREGGEGRPPTRRDLILGQRRHL